MLKRLWECLTVWSVPPTPLEGAQAIVSHSAGENSPTDPGCMNEFLASIIRDLYRQFKLPVIVQGELAPCLSDIPLTASPRQAEVAPRYLTTMDIALWHKLECEKRGITRVILVTYLPHYWRAMKATQKVGLIVMTPSGLKEIFDPKNSQPWGRYKWINYLYEMFLARPYSLWKGWL